jgi:hypothetical protein
VLVGALVALLALVGLGGCSDDDGDATRFCEDLAAFRDQGPIFPTRADGAREPDLRALDRLRELADHSPSEVRDDLATLVGYAEDLVRESQIGTESGSSFSAGDRWSRSVVESAQSAVIQYAASTCDLDLAG